ncbi:MAG: protein kinase, partial [Acidobacteria bacterium]|nr:protein kinase [Acidobacteriota bacterium]
MDPTEPSDRLKWIFEEACRIPETDRPAFLDRVCGGNSGLRQQVVELLERPARTQVWDDGTGPEGTIVAGGPGLVRVARDLTNRAHGVLQSGAEIDGKYRIDRLIGQGGMGVVYRATQISLERAVALKVLTSALVIDEGARQRFEREAVAMARLKHPNIVSIYDFGVSTDAGAYFVMEMLDGRSLADELRARGRLSIERT